MKDDEAGWPTTRTFPRTMNEAFPGTPEYAEWIEGPEAGESYRHQMEDLCIAVAAVVILGLFVMGVI